MKILLINVVFGKGSTGTIVRDLYNKYREHGHDTYVIYGRGDKVNLPNVYRPTYQLESNIHHLVANFTGNLYGGMFFSTNKIIRLIKKIKPDAVHLHCLNGYFVNIYRLLNYLNKSGVHTVLTNHAEFMMTANCGYSLACDKWMCEECKNCKRIKEFNGRYSCNNAHKYFLKMSKAISNFSNLIVTCVSPWLTNRFKVSQIFEDKRIEMVMNGTPKLFDKVSSQDPYADFLKQYNKQMAVLFVCSQRYNKEKGFDEFVKLANIMKDSKYLFVNIGINEKIKIDNIVCLGSIENSMLASYYYYANVTLVLSEAETFSMITAESLLCGTKVIGYLAGGPESIAIPQYTTFIKKDINELSKLIYELKPYNDIKYLIAKEAEKIYELDISVNNYLGLLLNGK